MNEYLKDFIKHFFIGGVVIGIYAVVTKYISPGYAAHVASSLPIVVTYIAVITYYNYSMKKTINILYLSFFAGLIWQMYVLVYYLGLKNNLSMVKTIILCIMIYLALSYLLYLYLKNLY